MSDVPGKDRDAEIDNLEDSLHEAIDAADKVQVTDIVDSISSHEALRQVSRMAAPERDSLISMLEPETAAELIEEAPAELAVSLIQDLDSSVAAKIMQELHTDTQADIVQEMEQEDSEAILSEMEPASADGVRSLSQYDPDTAGGHLLCDLGSVAAVPQGAHRSGTRGNARQLGSSRRRCSRATRAFSALAKFLA